MAGMVTKGAGRKRRLPSDAPKVLDRRVQWFLATLAAFSLFTFLALNQGVDPSSRTNVPKPYTLRWWLAPRETNAFFSQGAASDAAGYTELFTFKDAVVWCRSSAQRFLFSDDRGATWQEGSAPLPKGEQDWNVTSASFLNIDTGWIVAENPNSVEGRETAVFKTTDRGHTWQPLNEAPPFAQKIFCVNPEVLLLACDASLQRSSDGGKTWEPTSDKSEVLGFFARGDKVWAGIDQGCMLSLDAGETWKLGALGTGTTKASNPLFSFGSVRFVDDLHGFALKPPSDGPDFQLARTLDGGNTWQPLDQVSRLGGIDFQDEKIGIGYQVGGGLARTTDGGMHWTSTGSPWSIVRHVKFDPSASAWWATANDGLWKSDDHGQTWQLKLGTSVAGTISFADADNGWLLTKEGSLYRTTDGGQRWHSCPAPPQTSDIGFPTDSIGYALGEDPYRTEDGGETWTKRAFSTSPKHILFDRLQTFDSESLLLMDSLSAQAAQSQNGGKSWETFFLLGSVRYSTDASHTLSAYGDKIGKDKNAVQLKGTVIDLYMTPDRRHAWAVGVGGTVSARSTDGKTWTPQDSGVKENLRSVRFGTSTHGYVVGDGGTILVTSDGGNHWRKADANTKSHLTKVVAIGDKNAWILGDSCVLRTSDGGNHWNSTSGYSKAPAPWYWLSYLVSFGLLLPALRKPKKQDIVLTVAEELHSDSPISDARSDLLGLQPIAEGLSRFLRNENTMPPMTIAVTGEWGSGKTSLMNLLRSDLKRYGFRPVWFNAWHHQQEEHLLASLLATIRDQAIPPASSWNGMRYRLNLMGLRGERFVVVLCLCLFLIVLSTVVLVDHRDQWATWAANLNGLKDLLGGSGKATVPSSSIVASISAFVVLAGSVAGLWKTLSGALKGFGISPASLIAGKSSGARVKDLEAQTSFRHRFACEFREVTRALNPTTMPIVIDDLDRCKPENVLTVLEAINFLVSSGECFVILGMARERVERCVALAFKDVADIVGDDVSDSTPKSAEAATREKSLQFARQYLEKLINIEVPVPVADGERSRRLVIQESSKEDFIRAQMNPGAPRRMALRVLHIGLVLTAVYCGSIFARHLSGWVTQLSPPPPPKLLAKAAPSRESVPNAVAPLEGQSPATTVVTAPSSSLAAYVPPQRTEQSSLPYLGVILLIVLVGAWRLSIPPDVVLKDSDKFDETLKACYPLIASKPRSPRALKRYMNRLRYYAMCARPSTPEPPWWHRLAPWKREKTDLNPERILDEDKLVRLSAVEFTYPEWLEEKELYAFPARFLRNRVINNDVYNALLELHGITPEDLEAFKALRAGVRFAKDRPVN